MNVLSPVRRAGCLQAAILIWLAAQGSAGSAAAPPSVDANGLPLWVERAWDDRPVRLICRDREDLQSLLQAVPLRGFHRECIRPDRDSGGLVLELRVTEAEADALSAAGRLAVALPDKERVGRQRAEAAWARQAAGDPDKLRLGEFGDYPTHAQIGEIFAQWEGQYPNLARRFVWGESVEGRQLWGLVISDDVQNSEPEPEIRLSAAVHGDEPTSMVMLMDLAQLLLEQYGRTGQQQITDLVDGHELTVMPLHNPDGYVYGLRTNAMAVDLNRDFPEPTGGHSSQQPETLAFMNLAAGQNFVLSQNGHAGALVVNYPWDHTLELAPDDAAIVALSLEYSTYNLPMYSSLRFDRGITNGAAWYPVNGGLQDWSYFKTGCIDLTVELGENKWPEAPFLTELWEDNRESLLHLIRSARHGLYGVVRDSISGAPLSALITVAGNPQPVLTDPEHGDYYKLVPSGTWQMTVTGQGYAAKTLPPVTTVWGTGARVDIDLVPEGWEPPAASGAVTISAWPNPCRGLARLGFRAPGAGSAVLRLFDVRGHLVRDFGPLPSEGSVQWNGLSDQGEAVPSGTYLVRIEAASGSAAARLTLLR